MERELLKENLQNPLLPAVSAEDGQWLTKGQSVPVCKPGGHEWIEERFTAGSIFLRCIQEDGKCRNVTADTAELSLVLKIFVEANDRDRIVQFLSQFTTRKSRTGDEVFLGDICCPGNITKRQNSVRRGTNSDRLFRQSLKIVSRATCCLGKLG
nr:putative E3 ubiquitin-protein ligase LIN-1 [Tanacetum cinerariifolium]